MLRRSIRHYELWIDGNPDLQKKTAKVSTVLATPAFAFSGTSKVFQPYGSAREKVKVETWIRPWFLSGSFLKGKDWFKNARKIVRFGWWWSAAVISWRETWNTSGCYLLAEYTWRIIPVSKWLVTPIYKPFVRHLEGEQAYLGDLLSMVINHLLTGMILQVLGRRMKTRELQYSPQKGITHQRGCVLQAAPVLSRCLHDHPSWSPDL